MEIFILILGIFIGSSIAQDCWKTGCQPDSWGGCAQYQRTERGRQKCHKGHIYDCCAGGPGPGPAPGPPPGGISGLTFAQFRKAVTSSGYPTPSHEQYNNFKNNAHSQGRISSIQEAAMCLAQFLHESDGLRAKREYACASSNCPTNYRTPNCDAPGQFYYGRGYIQLTWCGNYKDASQALFKDARLVNDPDSVAKDDAIAWRTSFWYWSARVHDAPGVQQGKFGATTKAINGGIECSKPGHQTPPKRFKLYGHVRAAFGLHGPGDASGCP